MQTRDEYLQKLLEIKKPNCPHCGKEMNIWEVPPITFSDGLGWGEPFLFVCFNDDCPPFVSGWDDIEETYGHRASFRCINYPFTNTFELMSVFGKAGGEGQIVSEELINEQEEIEERIKTGFSILADCYVNKDFIKIISMAQDNLEPIRVRLKSIEMLGDCADIIEAIEPLRNIKPPTTKVADAIELAVGKIHGRCFTRECPFCAEIIKRRAKVCKHCGKELN
ncbi:MAG: zinc ribbon domain-containing protein [Desulforegulaceae bacterium]|nr:zinc ribbon domain-containing protein [Desulforegulaceae bacterium]